MGYPLQYSWASLVAQLVKNLPAMQETWFDPGLGRSPGKGKDFSLQYSDLENSMGCIVHGVAKSQTQLNDFHFQSFLLLNHLVNFWLMIKCSVTTKAQQEEKIYFPKGICYLQRIEGT